jgi:hypothetical protein
MRRRNRLMASPMITSGVRDADWDAQGSADRAGDQAMNPSPIHPGETSRLNGGRMRDPTPGWTSRNPRHPPPGPLTTSRVPHDIDHTERS